MTSPKSCLRGLGCRTVHIRFLALWLLASICYLARRSFHEATGHAASADTCAARRTEHPPPVRSLMSLWCLFFHELALPSARVRFGPALFLRKTFVRPARRWRGIARFTYTGGRCVRLACFRFLDNVHTTMTREFLFRQSGPRKFGVLRV